MDHRYARFLPAMRRRSSAPAARISHLFRTEYSQIYVFTASHDATLFLRAPNAHLRRFFFIPGRARYARVVCRSAVYGVCTRTLSDAGELCTRRTHTHTLTHIQERNARINYAMCRARIPCSGSRAPATSEIQIACHPPHLCCYYCWCKHRSP